MLARLTRCSSHRRLGVSGRTVPLVAVSSGIPTIRPMLEKQLQLFSVELSAFLPRSCMLVRTASKPGTATPPTLHDRHGCGGRRMAGDKVCDGSGGEAMGGSTQHEQKSLLLIDVRKRKKKTQKGAVPRSDPAPRPCHVDDAIQDSLWLKIDVPRLVQLGRALGNPIKLSFPPILSTSCPWVARTACLQPQHPQVLSLICRHDNGRSLIQPSIHRRRA